jgi:rhamnulokinase
MPVWRRRFCDEAYAMSRRYAAVDLGASSGRVVVGTVGPGLLSLDEVHRFANGPVHLPDGYRWDILGLWREVLIGLRQAGAGGPLVSIGVDSWAIDHGMLDRDGALLGNPWHHRDSRTDGVAGALFATVPPPELYRINGLQHLPFTTVYQLMASAASAQRELARQLLLVPDLIVYWLTGVAGTERTNASTTGLLDVTSGDWSERVLHASGVSPSLLAPVREPGDVVGPLLLTAGHDTGLAADVVVTTVGSHDTASAVVGVPADGPRFAFVACGTWALVGVELEAPVLSDASREANFTNEVGIDGTIRYLRNVMGLWVLSESQRAWQQQGEHVVLAALLAAAEARPRGGPVVDIDDPSLLPPGDMPSRIEALCLASGQPAPQSRAETVRCILDSLAQAFARAVEDAVRLSGRDIDVVHVVGGGAQNDLLCQLSADATGLPVLAGPVEATALGNVLVQARAHGDVSGGLDELRNLVRSTHRLTRFEPRG